MTSADCFFLFRKKITAWFTIVIMKKVTHLIVDSGAFIKNAPLHELAENIYTVDGAIKEIKDKATRQRLQFLPYVLKVKEPSSEAYKHVLEFSKKTGDFSSLSAVDLQILALTYQLEKEYVGTDHLKQEPNCEVTGKPSFPDKISGFYYPKESDIPCERDSAEDSNAVYTNNESENEVETENLKSEKLDNDKENETSDVGDKESNIDEHSDEENDSDEGWITSENIVEMQKKMGAVSLEEKNMCVACISIDFAVQNTLLQMGLNAISVNGLLIRHTRVFVLRCYACFKIINTVSKQFCPNCGNKTLKRVSVTLNEEGKKIIHINFRKPINIRGTRYSLPMPKGGKHAINPVLSEDQPIPQNRPSKMALKKIDMMSTDYEALSSPFALNDVYSRAASLGFRSNKGRSQKKNPNEWSKRTGNKK